MSSDNLDQPAHPHSLIRTLFCPLEDNFGPLQSKKARSEDFGRFHNLKYVFPSIESNGSLLIVQDYPKLRKLFNHLKWNLHCFKLK